MILKFSSENDERFRLLLEITMTSQEEQSSLKYLLESIRQEQSDKTEILTKLRDVVLPTDEAYLTMKQRRILDAIYMPELDIRFNDVPKEAVGTFGWCINDDIIPESHHELRISFRKWLQNGQGIFHIVGNPGSGKSTLMKFLSRHDETKNLLKSWAGHKELVLADFFFWKSGSRLQKSMDGLLRSLLHKILTKLPHLIPKVFPDEWQWDPQSSFLFLQPNVKALDIPDSKVQSAFDDIMQKHTLTEFAFCFFIDGLDEFNDPKPEMDRSKLCAEIQSWADSHPNNIKICVSSRKEEPFLRFPQTQRLWLHRLTEKDIRTTVTNRLEEHKMFIVWPREDRLELIDKVVSRAEGIFLWVVLVIRELRTDLDNELDLSSLLDTLNKVPTELSEYFTRIIDDIPSQDKIEAWTIFAVVAATEADSYSNRPKLGHYAFLKDFLSHKSPYFMFKDIKDVTSTQLMQRLKKFRSRFGVLCRGLLEVSKRPTFNGMDLEWSYTLNFVHRSLSEYFWEENLPESSRIQKFFASFDLQSVQTQLRIINIRCSLYYDSVLTPIEDLSHLLVAFKHSGPSAEHLVQLGTLERVLLTWQQNHNFTNEPDWSEFALFSTKRELGYASPKHLLSILALSCKIGLIDYIDWSFQNQSGYSANPRTKAELLRCVFDGIHQGQLDIKTLLSILKYFRTQNFRFSLSYKASGPFGYRRTDEFSPWQQHLACFFEGQPEAQDWKVTEQFLKRGADPYFYYHLFSEGKDEPESEGNARYVGTLHDEYRLTMRNQRNEINETTVYFETRSSDGSWNPKPAFLTHIISKIGPKMSFRDLVVHFQPDNMEAILDLIDQNLTDWPLQTEENEEVEKVHDTNEIETPVPKQVEFKDTAAHVKSDASNLLVSPLQFHFSRAMIIFFIISGRFPQEFYQIYKILTISRFWVGSYSDLSYPTNGDVFLSPTSIIDC
jgi:hypothetical protein